MRKAFIVILLLGIQWSSFSQSEAFYYFVQFTNKGPTSNSTISQYLSPKSLQKRKAYHIPITVQDFPVHQPYIDQTIRSTAAQLVYALKWPNGIVIKSVNELNQQELSQQPYVQQVQLIKRQQKQFKSSIQKVEAAVAYDYGKAKNQNEQIGIQHLHAKDWDGSNVQIAVFDNGFRFMDTLPVFQHLWKNNKILGQFDLVDGDRNTIPHGQHGMNVLSTIGAANNSAITGTAPDAQFWLFRTEDNASETLLEEFNWAKAAEIADSLGVDIINSSLGYSEFDDTTTSHTYADLNGEKTPVTVAANTAFEKGILVVNSAGNSGNNPWHYIIAPADGKNVLAVGAVDSTRTLSPFSSRGPNAVGMIKPNVCATGWRVTVASSIGGAQLSNGTSFSSPIIAGAAACLMEAFPNATHQQVFQAIQEASDRYYQPNNEYGHGIPYFPFAVRLLEEYTKPKTYPNADLVRDFIVYPNPAGEHIMLSFFELQENEIDLAIYDASGKQVFTKALGKFKGSVDTHINIGHLSAGFYLIELQRNGYQSYQSLIKE